MLKMNHVTITFQDVNPPQQVVEDFSLSMEPGEIVGIVGESGSGKTMTALSLMGLLKRDAHITKGSMNFMGKDLASQTQKGWEAIRGKEISMIFQEPMTSLNPVLTIGRQMEENLRLHTSLDKKTRYQKALDMMEKVGLPQPAKLYGQYPHQLSGGMRQRVMIGAALIGNPKLMIADEPTTALDVTIQAQILDLMKKLQKEANSSILLITHDLGVVAEMCTRVIVMYAGKIVEMAPVEKLFANPSHPYTQGLIASVPKLGSGVKVLPSIPGSVPDLASMPSGCRFAPRCKYATDQCRTQEPQLVEIAKDQKCRCWLTQGE